MCCQSDSCKVKTNALVNKKIKTRDLQVEDVVYFASSWEEVNNVIYDEDKDWVSYETRSGSCSTSGNKEVKILDKIELELCHKCAQDIKKERDVKLV